MDNTTQPSTNSTSNDTSKTPVTREDIAKKIKVEEIAEGIYQATTDTSKYVIEYDRNKCIGAASCAAIAPLTFFMDEENKAKIQEDVEDWDDDDTILAGAQSCPVFAIKIIEKATGNVVFPIDEMD